MSPLKDHPVKIIHTFLVSSIIGVSMLAGCQGVQPPARGRADITSHDKVFFSKEQGERLRKSTAILGDRVDRDQFGMLTVVVPIRSAVNDTLYLEYQYEFLDEVGRKVEGPIGWLPIVLEAGSPATLQFTSTSLKAENYRVTIRFQR